LLSLSLSVLQSLLLSLSLALVLSPLQLLSVSLFQPPVDGPVLAWVYRRQHWHAVGLCCPCLLVLAGLASSQPTAVVQAMTAAVA
jgi:hypothetical protein